MLFKSKPHLYLRFFEKSISYMAMDVQNQKVIEKGHLVFDTHILQEGRVTNNSIIRTRLDAFVKEKKWKNTKVSILLPDDFVTVRHEEIPSQLNKSEAKEYIDLHINHTIRLPFDNPKVDFEIINQSEDKQTIFLTAYPKEEVEIYLDLLEEIGLKPYVADISALSVYRVVKTIDSLKNKFDTHHLLLQWHPLETSVTVFNKDIPQFNRHTRLSRLVDAWSIKEDGSWVWNKSDVQLQDNLDEQLNGLERFLEFYRYSVLKGNGNISSIILTGNYPNLDRLEKLITNRFSIDVRTLPMPQNLDSSDSALYGLSLKESNKKNNHSKAMSKKKKSIEQEVTRKGEEA